MIRVGRGVARWRRGLGPWLLVVWAAVSGCAGAASSPAASGGAAPGGPGTSACLVVDTDVALDDVRAMAALLPRARVVAVVATEGTSSVARGAMAVSHLLAAASLATPAVVVLGLASPSPSSESWLAAARTGAERLNGFLAEAVPRRESLPSAAEVEEAVRRATAACAEVRVAVLGPWTSFVRYRAALGERLRQVVAQGLPLEDVPAGRSPGFNCRYDLEACRQAHALLRPGGLGTWVDVPRNVSPAYAPTAEMVAALGPAGLPGTLRALLTANPASWSETLMWDDSAALFLLRPDAFAPKGMHQEPTVSPEALRGLWLTAVGSP